MLVHFSRLDIFRLWKNAPTFRYIDKKFRYQHLDILIRERKYISNLKDILYINMSVIYVGNISQQSFVLNLNNILTRI